MLSESFEDWLYICYMERVNMLEYESRELDLDLERARELDWEVPRVSEVPPDEICSSIVRQWGAYCGG